MRLAVRVYKKDLLRARGRLAEVRFGLQPILRELQERFPSVLVRAYADDVHLLGADSERGRSFHAHAGAHGGH
jgi:hypothetical protein